MATGPGPAHERSLFAADGFAATEAVGTAGAVSCARPMASGVTVVDNRESHGARAPSVVLPLVGQAPESLVHHDRHHIVRTASMIDRPSTRMNTRVQKSGLLQGGLGCSMVCARSAAKAGSMMTSGSCG
jgi:hypothetical protein